MSLVVKAGKQVKKLLRTYVLPPEVHHLSYTRRIERIRTDRRVCAMTFDDGPMDLPASPDEFHGRALTDVILDTLAEHGARGTFDVVGDTSENYPDRAGREGSASWGGIRYDHYPDIYQDDKGGAENVPRLIRRILDEGHQITNHGYRHVIFGRKAIVYGRREHLQSFSRAERDLMRLDELMRTRYGYRMTMGRPPHYVDRMKGGFTSYDVYDRMGYQYLAASFDGAGWLPSTLSGRAALDAEIDAMVSPLRRELERDPDFFCGQIIFQKDGYNMARRTPVAWGLARQLELLDSYDYQVVTVADLMRESPFADVGQDDPLFDELCALAKERAIVYSDDRLRLEQTMTAGELAMLLCPREEALRRRWSRIRKSGRREHPYCGAMEWCVEQGIMARSVQPDAALESLPEGLFGPVPDLTRRSVYAAWRGE